MNMQKRRKQATTIALYFALFGLGVLLYGWAHEQATIERGYIAYGGEVFILGLPLFVWLVKKTVRDWWHTINELRGGTNEA
jgi:drug/metabolite transporter superfamily protein YnfA